MIVFTDHFIDLQGTENIISVVLSTKGRYMFGKLAKGIGYFVLFLFCIAFIGAIFGKDDSTDKVKTASSYQVEPDQKVLHQKQVFSMNKYFFKGKLYNKEKEPPYNWIGARFYTQGDSLYYGDNYSHIAKYIGSTDDEYDVYKSETITFTVSDKEHRSHNIIYVDRKSGSVVWEMVDELNNSSSVHSGSLTIS